ncbi:MAG: HU family DNA-binding protein [Opitutales bacterium]|nr:HU family DNA-binding protein [Opitutales bacterium]
MNKSQLVDAVANNSGLTIKDSEKAVDAFVAAVKEGLKSDGNVQLIGFGSFSVGERSARTGINPRTGQKIEIAASKTVKFKAGAKLKEIL